MVNSSKSLIEHIPCFLEYCHKKGLSQKTQESYKLFLKKFIVWLKITNKENLKPHELTFKDIEEYKNYLSQTQHRNGRFLRKSTQNYYLIALRALLNYLSTQGINSLSVNSIKLLRYPKIPNNKILTLDQIKSILSAPDINTEIGLRDRAILETLIFAGLKVSQLTSLNRDQIVLTNAPVSRNSLLWIKKYLQIRRDKNKALFISYRGVKTNDRRLTSRSVQRIVYKYSKKANLHFLVTPEVLRKAYALALINEQEKIKILHPVSHTTLLKENYTPPLPSFATKDLRRIKKKQIHTDWHTIEKIITQEIIWLRKNILALPEGYNKTPLPLKCNNCILRKIAILIVSEQVRAREIQATNKDLWNGLTFKSKLNKINRHGKEWHRRMMDIIYEYFKKQGYQVEIEPVLNYGRADLGVYLNSQRSIYIEIGTVSLYKLWYNLSSMKNVIFLIIPSCNKVIELQV